MTINGVKVGISWGNGNGAGLLAAKEVDPKVFRSPVSYVLLIIPVAANLQIQGSDKWGLI